MFGVDLNANLSPESSTLKTAFDLLSLDISENLYAEMVLCCTDSLTHHLSHQALKDSKEVEVIDMKIRRKVDPEKWPLPGLAMPNQTHTDFSQLINCPEFVPRQMTEEPKGEPFDLLLVKEN